MQDLESKQNITCYTSLREDLDKKKEEREQLFKQFTPEKRLYVRLVENLARLKDNEQAYIINGDQEKINTIKKYIENAEADLNDFLE